MAILKTTFLIWYTLSGDRVLKVKKCGIGVRLAFTAVMSKKELKKGMQLLTL